jgi:hypothetical protein
MPIWLGNARCPVSCSTPQFTPPGTAAEARDVGNLDRVFEDALWQTINALEHGAGREAGERRAAQHRPQLPIAQSIRLSVNHAKRDRSHRGER